MSPTRPRIQLSATQVVASALAAITATVGASYLGVAGTVIGAAVASVLTVVGNAVYSHSIQRTSARVRTVVPAASRFGGRPVPVVVDEPTPVVPRRRSWSVLAAACLGVFVGVLVVVTAVEVVAGRPLTDVLRGRPGSGTSVLGDSRPQPRPTVTITPAVVTKTPTMTVTGSPVTTTVTPTRTATSTPSHAPDKTPDSTATPTPTPTPTGTSSQSGTTGSSGPLG
jgi:hypothetical protein